MENRKKLLLALAIVEWEGVVTHLEAMTKAGIQIPDGVESSVGVELGVLTATWHIVTGAASIEACVEQARSYLTENLADADALTAEVTAGMRNG